MKQTKKLTWNQRSFLEKIKVDTEGVRLVEETKEYLKVQKPDGEILTIVK